MWPRSRYSCNYIESLYRYLQMWSGLHVSVDTVFVTAYVLLLEMDKLTFSEGSLTSPVISKWSQKGQNTDLWYKGKGFKLKMSFFLLCHHLQKWLNYFWWSFANKFSSHQTLVSNSFKNTLTIPPLIIKGEIQSTITNYFYFMQLDITVPMWIKITQNRNEHIPKANLQVWTELQF